MELIRRSQRGDTQAFEAFYEQYKNLVYRTAVLMLDNPADAEDVVQEVFVQVYRSAGSYDARKGAVTTWLHRMTVNRCLNKRRWYSRRPRLLPLDTADQSIEAADDSLADDLEMRRALQSLDAQLRGVIVLRYYWNLSYSDIAEVLELPLGTVKSRLHKGIALLREAFTAAGEAAPDTVYQHREVKP